jgi:hypothetical protein
MNEADYWRLGDLVHECSEHLCPVPSECSPCFLLRVLSELTAENDRLRAVIASLIGFGIAVVE